MIIATTILTIVILLAVLSSWVFARLWCKPKRLNPAQTPMDMQLPYEEIEFNSHGAILRGWFIPSYKKGPQSPAVIVVHGWSHNAAKMLHVAKLLNHTGVATLLFDARGHGFSDGDGPITILKFAQDILSAASFLKSRPDVDSDRIGIVGHSMGGSSTILATSMGPTIRAAVTSAAFADPFQLTKLTMRRLHIPLWPFFYLVRFFIEGWLGRSMQSLAPVNYISQISTPLLLIHGADDQFVPPANLDQLNTAAHPKYVKRLLIEGRRHSDVTVDLQYESQMIAHIREFLCDGGPSQEQPVIQSESAEFVARKIGASHEEFARPN